ncbi:hypothetical protein CN934_32760 [Ensifer sp. MMN_5]|nr:hypothetical protein CN934_32760 [Ensifer sp. MMN_5]
MTRHGTIQRSATSGQPPATDPRAPTVIIVVDMATTSRVPDRQHRVEAQRRDLSVSIPALLSGSRAIADINRKSKSP